MVQAKLRPCLWNADETAVKCRKEPNHGERMIKADVKKIIMICQVQKFKSLSGG
jgi:hypothetical protein